ncbi:MAG: class I SAM-dependent methyltransferase [Ardenticatenaceae bacterium]|nr:class I SAM-dependent methyltransferase [Ardenticatenaceae bacterium]HBY98081.1 hypothetical protein [Chloroflexota bacterium]
MSRSIAFDRAASFYDATRGFPPGVESQVAAGLAEMAGLTGRERVLEIGVGTGRIALPLSRHARVYIGVDLSRPMLEVLRGKQRAEAVAVVEGDITHLPLAGQQFDLVVGVHILHLVSGWLRALAEVARVLRPRGALLLAHQTDDEDEPRQIVTHFRALLAEAGAKPKSLGPRDDAVIAAALAGLGFQQVEARPAGVWQDEESPRQVYDMLVARTWSSLWALPESRYREALGALRGWLDERYPDLDQPLPITRSVQAALFRRTDGL